MRKCEDCEDGGKPMISLRYLDPTARTFDDSVLGWLLQELPGATDLRFATGYFEASVLDWLEQPLEELLDRGGSIQGLIGSNGGQTGRADLERLLEVLAHGPGGRLHVEYAEGGIFHPKVFVVESAARVAAIVGSGNLTSNGSLVNVEAGVVLETDAPGPPPEAPLDAVIASIDADPRPDAFRIASVDDLDRLEKLGIIGRVVTASPANVSQARADRQRERRRRAGVRTRPGVLGVPERTRRRAASAPSRGAAPVAGGPAATGDLYGLRFAPNDLKTTGTREFSVSRSMRDWAESVLGRELHPGEGTLLTVVIEARLAASPMSVLSTIDPVRIWAAGGSGGTHADVRMVLGNRLRAGLEDESIRLTGLPVPGGSIGVFQLPDEPQSEPARLTVFLPTDPDFALLDAKLGRSGREQKRHFRVGSLMQLPPWP